ncbi:acyl-CoA dehydrogenase family protein [Streptomyces sp. NBC_01190]|uniref:acyl-CoA dehydrogenase family protein n=1 Tax=Streptomyces sp. NBC_01190 TaxID=2903767 RepID=UPI00386AE72D|nr:acyl-CoA dehydrogenase family protein [Streptomyces sp. NBC_01190]
MDDSPIGRATRTVAAHAERSERERRLGAEVADVLTAAGFARHFVPSGWGGVDGGFAELTERTAEVAEGCASAAWCAALWAAHARFARYLPPAGQRDIWGASPDVRIAAAVAPPFGTAVPAAAGDGGGWRLSGEWGRASGVDLAAWVLLTAREAHDSGRGPRVFAVPRSEVTVRDTWDSVGMRGTGSNTVLADDVLVPGHRSFLLADLTRGDSDPAAPRCHTAPTHLAGGLLFCAPALGAARRALQLWSDWAAGKADAHGRPNHEDPSVRETLARASAGIDAAHLLLAEAARRADDEPVTELAVARNWRDAAVAADLLVTVVERLLRTGGAHVRDGGGELQRLWRDVHTIGSHGVLRLEPAAGAYAAALFAVGGA